MNIDGVRLEYRRITGRTNGPTVVFLHEGLGSVSRWRDFPDAVCARTGCHGVVYSRQGHGRSDPRTTPPGPDFMHHEALVVLPRLLKTLNIGRPILIGHSDGASIALIAAGADAVQPVAMVLEAPHVLVEDLTIESIRHVRERYRTSDLHDRLARHHGRQTAALFNGWTDVWLSPAFRGWNIQSSLTGIACPLLVIQGADDEYGTQRQAEAIAAAVGPRCRVLMLEDCGHAPHIDRREIVEVAMAGFIVEYAGRPQADRS